MAPDLTLEWRILKLPIIILAVLTLDLIWPELEFGHELDVQALFEWYN